jgi:hypothetical protein
LFHLVDSWTSTARPRATPSRITVVMTVYLTVNTTAELSSRWSAASTKFSGALSPRLPAKSPQSDTDIWNTSPTGMMKNSTSITVVGMA